MSGSQGQPWVEGSIANGGDTIQCSTPNSRPGTFAPIGTVLFFHPSVPDGNLPTPFLKDTPYYVVNTNNVSQINVSLTKGGSAVFATQAGTMGIEIVLPGLFSGGAYISDDNHRAPQSIPKPYQALDAGWQSQKVSDGTTGPSQPQQAGVGNVPYLPYVSGTPVGLRSIPVLGSGTQWFTADQSQIPPNGTPITVVAMPGQPLPGGMSAGAGLYTVRSQFVSGGKTIFQITVVAGGATFAASAAGGFIFQGVF